MISSPKNKQVKEIRSKYGYSARTGIDYVHITTTAQDLFNQLIHGKVMCNLFNPKKYRKDRTFGSSEKNDENFVGSYTIGVDIEKTAYKSIADFIAKLRLKPSFYYTSHSNSADKIKFRIIYH